MRTRLLALALSAVPLVAACGGSSSGGTVGPSAPSSAGGSSTNAAGCTVPAPSPKPLQTFASEPPLTIATATYDVTLHTNCGDVTLALDGAKAPHTVNSFVFLAGKHYFDDSPCHRLTTQGIYVLQCGDPTGTGQGGPGYTIPDENLTGATYPKGTVAMANTGQPHTGGSQFFLVYQDTALPAQYTPFGTVVGGLDVLQRIAAAGDDQANGPGDGHPTADPVIESISVTKA